LYSRTQLKLEWINAVGELIRAGMPAKVLEQPEQLVSP